MISYEFFCMILFVILLCHIEWYFMLWYYMKLYDIICIIWIIKYYIYDNTLYYLIWDDVVMYDVMSYIVVVYHMIFYILWYCMLR
jgi:hypothetical protein